MIVIPAILVAIVEAAFIGGIAGAVICGMEDKRTLPPDAPKELRTAHKCLFQGAVTGAAFGLVFPVMGVVDDLARPTVGAVDDMAIASSNNADDLARPVKWGKRIGVRRAAKDFMAPLRMEANVSRAQYYNSLRLPKTAGPKESFVYVADIQGTSASRLFKIGHTTRPAQRLKEIQSKLNRTVGGKVNYTCIIFANNGIQLESTLHAAFSMQRIRNFAAGTEYFRLNSAQLKAACSY